MRFQPFFYDIKRQKVLLKKNKSNDAHLKSMEDAAMEIKIWRKLKSIILEYLSAKDSKMFPSSMAWEELLIRCLAFSLS